jgi:hypothetical protein
MQKRGVSFGDLPPDTFSIVTRAIGPILRGAGAPESFCTNGLQPARGSFVSLELRAHGTPDAQRIRSLACKNKFLARKHSHHEHAENIRRSARNGFRGSLRIRSPRRPIHASGHRSWRKAMCRDHAVWANPRNGIVVSLDRIKKRRAFSSVAPDHPARASNTARGHRIPPRVS